nr:MAG TPA: hypothetical protein [Caudoviricetes sp.]
MSSFLFAYTNYSTLLLFMQFERSVILYGR